MLKPASRNESIKGEFTVPGKSLGSKHTVSSGAKVWGWLAINVHNLGSMRWCGHCGAFKIRGFTGDCEVMGHCPAEWIQVPQDHTLLRQSCAP